MSGRKGRQGSGGANQETKDAAEKLLDAIIKQAMDEPQHEAFYVKSAAALREADESSVVYIARRLQKAGAKEQEILLHLMKHFRGIEHMRVLQDFVRREMFLPRIGLLILELFNKADVIIEEGLASRLLELDNLTQRIRLAIESSDPNDRLIAEFILRDQNERAGIIAQLMDETGEKISAFILGLLEKDEKAASEALNMFAESADMASFKILSSLFEKTKRKEIEKIIKKMAHGLKQKGVVVKAPEMKKKKESILKKIALPETRAFMSAIDPEGYRLVFMIRPVTTFEYKIFNILISDVSGLQNIEVVSGLRKECQLFINRLSADQKIEFLETSPENAAFLVEEACTLTGEHGKMLPTTIEQWHATFGEMRNARKTPLIYDVFSAEQIGGAGVRDDKMGLLLDEEIIILWFVVSDEAKENWRRMTNILYSPLVLSDAQKKERIKGLMMDTAQQFFNEAKKRSLKRRFEEQAWWLHAKGQTEKALAALQAAALFADPGLQAEHNRLCMGIVQRGFKLFESSYKGAKGKGDTLIADPNDFSLIA